MSAADMKMMEQVFARSEQAHSESMAAIMQKMTAEKAWDVLEKRNLTTPALLQVTRSLQGTRSFLRKKSSSPSPPAPPPAAGYSGIEGARIMLNDMIYESMKKYDIEITECTKFYTAQCATMEELRGQIAESNYICAESRKLILDAQSTINICEVHIPTKEYRLKQHLLMCQHELKKMNDRLVIVEGDIKILTKILEMTECKSFVQKTISLLHCHDNCTKTSFITFGNDDLRREVSRLQASVTQGLMKDAFKDLVPGVTFSQASTTSKSKQPVIKKTYFDNPPLPRTEVPADPCDDPELTPVPIKKRASKCSIKNSPQCPKIQERFLLIQAGVQDERDQLKKDIAEMEHYRDKVQTTLNREIADDKATLLRNQKNLAEATEKEATAAETGRETKEEHDTSEQALRKRMDSCSANYLNYENDICALKKIRGELYKMKGSGHDPFFQDCKVAEWTPSECSKTCGGGEQTLSRGIIARQDRGTQCLPLSEIVPCNEYPCPVDCKIEGEWSEWSKCTADCGIGSKSRFRQSTAAKHGGKPCPATSETEECNTQACEKDCTLNAWSHWSKCSKDCDGGTNKRQRTIRAKAEGAGSCPDMWSEKRLEYKKCNDFACGDPRYGFCSAGNVNDQNMYTCQTLPNCCGGYEGVGTSAATVQCLPSEEADDPKYTVKCPAKPMQCKAHYELDVVLLIDGSGSVGSTGWTQEKNAALEFVDSFSGTDSKAALSVVLYSGPSFWPGVWKCQGESQGTVDLENDCKIKSVIHLTKSYSDVKTAITNLQWPMGSTLTSLALQAAQAELQLGRKDAKSVVVVLTDGRPMSYRKTWLASMEVRKSARLVWVPITKYAPLSDVKSWATRRWKENVVRVREFVDLEKPDMVNHVIADICPMYDDSELL